MKCDCEKGGHHFHRCTKCGDSTAGYKYEKKWVCYICMGYELTSSKSKILDIIGERKCQKMTSQIIISSVVIAV